MKRTDFYYDLPESCIAQIPLDNRTDSKLLCLDRKTGQMTHQVFSDLMDQLTENDVLVMNNSRVIPARLYGMKEGMEKPIEVLLLKQIRPLFWEVLLKPAKKIKVGQSIRFSETAKGTVEEIGLDGKRMMRFSVEGKFEDFLETHGEMPLPPYIHEKLEDPNRYQTVYNQNTGSVAAPTAGLHFTKPMLETLRQKGVQIEMVTLHVGLGTFRPVKEDEIEDHIMHDEYFQIEPDVLQRLNKAKRDGKRIIGVGTTSVRTLESVSKNGVLTQSSGWTNIFIYPPYRFQFVDSMITNFHLPESTLLMMISAFADKELIFSAYREAIKQQYRFFSFGDAMWIF